MFRINIYVDNGKYRNQYYDNLHGMKIFYTYMYVYLGKYFYIYMLVVMYLTILSFFFKMLLTQVEIYVYV